MLGGEVIVRGLSLVSGQTGQTYACLHALFVEGVEGVCSCTTESCLRCLKWGRVKRRCSQITCMLAQCSKMALLEGKAGRF